MDEQLETSSVRVRDAAVSLAEKGPRHEPLFLAIGDKPRVTIAPRPSAAVRKVAAQFR